MNKIKELEERFAELKESGKPLFKVYAVWLDEGQEVDRLLGVFSNFPKALEFTGGAIRDSNMYIETIYVR